MKKQDPKLKVLNRMLIYSEEGKGIINDSRHVQYSGIGRPRSVPTCTSENIDAVIGLLPTSGRRVQHELNGTVRNQLFIEYSFYSNVISYMLSVMQHLKELV